MRFVGRLVTSLVFAFAIDVSIEGAYNLMTKGEAEVALALVALAAILAFSIYDMWIGEPS